MKWQRKQVNEEGQASEMKCSSSAHKDMTIMWGKVGKTHFL